MNRWVDEHPLLTGYMIMIMVFGLGALPFYIWGR